MLGRKVVSQILKVLLQGHRVLNLRNGWLSHNYPLNCSPFFFSPILCKVIHLNFASKWLSITYFPMVVYHIFSKHLYYLRSNLVCWYIISSLGKFMFLPWSLSQRGLELKKEKKKNCSIYSAVYLGKVVESYIQNLKHFGCNLKIWRSRIWIFESVSCLLFSEVCYVVASLRDRSLTNAVSESCSALLLQFQTTYDAPSWMVRSTTDRHPFRVYLRDRCSVKCFSETTTQKVMLSQHSTHTPHCAKHEPIYVWLRVVFF